MACCGGARKQVYANNAITDAKDESGAGGIRAVPQTVVSFEYVGERGLTVAGPITRRRYRFESPGARVEVDARDAPSFVAVPNLRRVHADVGV